MGGYGLPKFIPRVRRYNLEAQNSRTFAEVVQGSHGRIEDRKQLKQLGFTAKGKMTQLGEKEKGVNLRLKGAKVGDFPMGKSDKVEVVEGDRKEQSINEEEGVGEQYLADSKISCPNFSWNSKVEYKGKKSDARRFCWTGSGLVVEVDVTGSRRVFWDRKKGGDTLLRRKSRAEDRVCYAPKTLQWVARGNKKAENLHGLGLGLSPLLTETHMTPFSSFLSGPSTFEVGESSVKGDGGLTQALTPEARPMVPPQPFVLQPEVSDWSAGPPTVADGSFSASLSSDELTVSPGKFVTVISWSLVELFLSGFFWSLSRAGSEDLGVLDGIKEGWDSCANLRPNVALEQDLSSLAMIPMKAVSDVPGASALVVGEMSHSELGLGGEVSLAIPFLSITPLRLPVSAEMSCGYVALECANTMDISSWVKNRLPGFSKLVGLPLSRHEKLCIALLQKIEKETEDAKLLNRKVTVPRKAVSNKVKGKRELRNLKSSVNYDGR